MDTTKSLCRDEVVQYIAHRHHITPHQLIDTVLHGDASGSPLESNEKAIISELISRTIPNRHPEMTLQDFKDMAARREPLDSDEAHQFMHDMSDEARCITFKLNTAYHTQQEVRQLLSQLLGYEVPQSLRVFPPFYADFGKNIRVGEGVFINACCHFQDHGGVNIGDGCQIGHNVVFATLNHGLAPEERRHTYPAPITLGRNVWVGSNATILPGVTIGDDAIVGAGAVVTHDVEAGTVVGGAPARVIKNIYETRQHNKEHGQKKFSETHGNGRCRPDGIANDARTAADPNAVCRQQSSDTWTHECQEEKI